MKALQERGPPADPPFPGGGQEGSVLIEVLVSSILLVALAVGVFGAFDTANRSTAEQRHRARAHGLAEADLARMRTMRISDLSSLSHGLGKTRVETVEGVSYTVESVVRSEADETATSSCKAGESSADYFQIRSTVTWPGLGSRPPVVAQSLVAPPNGSILPNRGALVVQIEGAAGAGVPGVGISATGPTPFAGTTGDPSGCAIFGNLLAGEYAVTVSAPLGGELVDADGNAPKPEIGTSVVAEGTATLALQLDEPGEIPVSFVTRANGPEEDPVPTEADSVVVYNTGMSVARVFGTPGVPAAEVVAAPLFPFGSPYAVYAGGCEAQNPNPAAEPDPPPAIADVQVQPGAGSPVTIELPALHLRVWDGAGATGQGNPVEGAEVTIVDTNCVETVVEDEEGEGEEVELGEPVVRTATTNAEGGLDHPGLPFGEYEICVSDGATHVEVGQPVIVPADPEAMELGTELDVYLGHEGAEPGECP